MRSMFGYVTRSRSPRNATYASSERPSKSAAVAYTKFFIVSVATTSLLSPSVYAAAKRSPNTSIVTDAANGGAERFASRKNTTRVFPYWISSGVIAAAPTGPARSRGTPRDRSSARLRAQDGNDRLLRASGDEHDESEAELLLVRVVQQSQLAKRRGVVDVALLAP